MPLGAARFGLLGGVADLGKLELIETQTVTSVTTVDFTSIQESTYNVHFATTNNIKFASDSRRLTVRLYESGVLETASVYAVAALNGSADGTFIEQKSASQTSYRYTDTSGNDTGETCQGFIYFYNLGDNTRYSFFNHIAESFKTTGNYQFNFGSGFMEQTSLVDGIQFSGDTFSGTISLYGLNES